MLPLRTNSLRACAAAMAVAIDASVRPAAAAEPALAATDAMEASPVAIRGLKPGAVPGLETAGMVSAKEAADAARAAAAIGLVATVAAAASARPRTITAMRWTSLPSTGQPCCVAYDGFIFCHSLVLLVSISVPKHLGT